jgi:hypothetical protein
MNFTHSREISTGVYLETVAGAAGARDALHATPLYLG